MVKPIRRHSHLQKPTSKKRIKWWRGILGAALTAFIIVPYMMGSDIEKYLNSWVSSVNQQDSKLHLALVHYERHWFSSDGDIVLTSNMLSTPLTMHVKIYHGPLLFQDNYPRLGLALIKGDIDASNLFGPQAAIKLSGTTQLEAFIPYFSDREIWASLPAIKITDKANHFIYTVPSLTGNFDGDNLVQIEMPSLKVSELNGDSVAELNIGLLRILPNNHSSFAAKNIHIFHQKNGRDATVINNLLIDGETSTDGKNMAVNLSLHFDDLDPSLADATILPFGPMEFKFQVSGLRQEGVFAFLELFRAFGLEKDTLTPEEAAKLIKTLSSTLSANTQFNLSANLKTQDGPINIQFNGGFTDKAIQEASDFIDAFYTKGAIKLSANVMHALADYKLQSLAFILDFLKPNGPEYSATIDIKDGKININGKNIKEASANTNTIS
ncbi:MAG TPA: DUF945 family protein [Gammaproteobacteria bacterium]|nr:DUF945 family protein [Gammaproteobacteria bacterium]